MRRDLMLAALVALLAFALGWVLRGRGQTAAWVERDRVLAARDSLAVVATIQETKAEAAARTADSLDLLLTRKTARADGLARRATHLEQRVIATRDSLTELGATTVPIAVYDTVIALAAWRKAEVEALGDALHTARQQIRAHVQLDSVRRATIGTLTARALRAEAALDGLRPPTEGKLLGLLPKPSRTVTLLAGVVIGVVATR
jgi:hypothetical protein